MPIDYIEQGSVVHILFSYSVVKPFDRLQIFTISSKYMHDFFYKLLSDSTPCLSAHSEGTHLITPFVLTGGLIA